LILDRTVAGFVGLPLDGDLFMGFVNHCGLQHDHRRIIIRCLRGCKGKHIAVRGATDDDGNGPTYSNNFTFTTDPEPDTTAPVISSQPIIIAKTHNTATVRWETDEPSNSEVQFQTDFAGPPYADFENDSGNVTVHTVTLSGLTAETEYFFRVGSTDVAGNGPTYSNNFSFNTDHEPDLDSPVILNVPEVVNITHDSATIQWETDETSTSMVEYQAGSAGPPYEGFESDPDNVTVHVVTITGLTPKGTLFNEDDPNSAFNGIYHFRVSSVDQAGNPPTYSIDLTFSTEEAPDETPPVITVAPTATGVTDTTATIEWTTDETSTSIVEYQVGSGGPPYTYSESDATNSRTHAVSLTGLTPSTTYHFRVGQVDQVGNGPSYSIDYTFETDVAPDFDPPIETGLHHAVAITDHTATIEWETDEISNSIVEYDFDAYGAPFRYAESEYYNVIVHRVTLTRLLANTTYYYRVRSVDPSGNISGWWGSAGWTFATEPDVTNPSIIEPVTVDRDNSTVDIKYNEWNMQNANIEANYTFSPSINFRTMADGNDDINYIGDDTYRLFLASIPDFQVIVLTVSGITDLTGNPVFPASITINDADDDDLPDDWESDYFTNPNNTQTGKFDDYDGDGWDNYTEYLYGSSPANAYSEPAGPSFIESIPHNGAGNDNMRVPNNTSFAVRINSPGGIDLTDLDSISFTIDDGDNAPYVRDLSSAAVVRVIKLTNEPDTSVTSVWVVYDRAGEAGPIAPVIAPVYAYSTIGAQSTISITANAKDIEGGYTLETEQVYSFSIETQEAHDEAAAAMAGMDTEVIVVADPPYDSGIQLNIANSPSAQIHYNSSDIMTPMFGPLSELPSNPYNGVGIAISLLPPTVFSTPVRVYIPCPGNIDVSRHSVYMFNGTQWVEAIDGNNNIRPGGEGWVVPDSTDLTKAWRDDSDELIGIKVYHFSGVQGGINAGANISGEKGGGGGCFIATAAFGSKMEKHVRILSEFRDKRLLSNWAGKKFVDLYYEYSPTAAVYLCEHDGVRNVVRYMLIPITGAAWLMLYVHPAIFLFALFCLTIGTFYLGVMRRNK